MSKSWVLGAALCLAMATSAVAATSTPAGTDFPARTFFNARGVMETPFGNFFTGLRNPNTVAGRSAYCPIANASVTSLPPFGSTYGAGSRRRCCIR